MRSTPSSGDTDWKVASLRPAAIISNKRTAIEALAEQREVDGIAREHAAGRPVPQRDIAEPPDIDPGVEALQLIEIDDGKGDAAEAAIGAADAAAEGERPDIGDPREEGLRDVEPDLLVIARHREIVAVAEIERLGIARRAGKAPSALVDHREAAILRRLSRQPVQQPRRLIVVGLRAGRKLLEAIAEIGEQHVRLMDAADRMLLQRARKVLRGADRLGERLRALLPERGGDQEQRGDDHDAAHADEHRLRQPAPGLPGLRVAR